MTQREVIDIGREFLVITMQVALPVLLFGLVAGVLVSIFQAVTMIQEFTLTFVPKLLAVVLALAIFGSWMLSMLVSFLVRTFSHIPQIST